MEKYQLPSHFYLPNRSISGKCECLGLRKLLLEYFRSKNTRNSQHKKEASLVGKEPWMQPLLSIGQPMVSFLSHYQWFIRKSIVAVPNLGNPHRSTERPDRSCKGSRERCHHLGIDEFTMTSISSPMMIFASLREADSASRFSAPVLATKSRVSLSCQPSELDEGVVSTAFVVFRVSFAEVVLIRVG